MSRALIITVAGKATRFRESIGKDELKAIYGNPSILEIMLGYALPYFEKIVIVGGYKFKELESFIQEKYANENIVLVENELYEYGSNVSLVKGILALDEAYDEILFAEGDLVVDKKSLIDIIKIPKDVVSYTNKLIDAKTSVIFYQNMSGKICYKYDTEHKQLYIEEPFKIIANSGQIWKFGNFEILKKIAQSFTDDDKNETNLATIESYFSAISKDTIAFMPIKDWFNCNTIDDYNDAIEFIRSK